MGTYKFDHFLISLLFGCHGFLNSKIFANSCLTFGLSEMAGSSKEALKHNYCTIEKLYW